MNVRASRTFGTHSQHICCFYQGLGAMAPDTNVDIVVRCNARGGVCSSFVAGVHVNAYASGGPGKLAHCIVQQAAKYSVALVDRKIPSFRYLGKMWTIVVKYGAQVCKLMQPGMYVSPPGLSVPKCLEYR
jgi:hypothetical protein